MRSMSLDVGTRTIGVAASDLMGMIANGVETIRRTSEERDLQRTGGIWTARRRLPTCWWNATAMR